VHAQKQKTPPKRGRFYSFILIVVSGFANAISKNRPNFDNPLSYLVIIPDRPPPPWVVVKKVDIFSDDFRTNVIKLARIDPLFTKNSYQEQLDTRPAG